MKTIPHDTHVTKGAHSKRPPEYGNIPPWVCARVLAYVQGLEMDPILGVELALECLRRTDAARPASAPACDAPDAEAREEALLHAAMKELHALLEEKGREHGSPDKTQPLHCAPPVNRRAMLPEEKEFSRVRSALRGLLPARRGKKAQGSEPPRRRRPQLWEGSARRRRIALLALIIFPTALAAHIMYSLLPTGGYHFLRVIITILFAVLFAWISVGFWSSTAGLLMMLTRQDRFALGKNLDHGAPVPNEARTALLFPVYNEDMRGVSAILRTVLHSLREKGLERHFDLFMLSDSTNPDVWIEEEEAWHQLCREENAFDKIFYRRRKMNTKRKSGNVADFCRRWGANYRYMIVFDADSLLSADSLLRMVKIMEAHPSIGILQTAPKIIKARSFFARAQQFANHLYGPLFAAGLHFWQLGDAQYWGHNAIIRVEPFMRHCQLPPLPGKEPLGGAILSHDFVEAALMRRAGYGVWLAYDLDGSYEQTPPGLMEELIRDRRWCQGNLQHFRLIFTRGFFPTHRALFINGIMSYVSALLWFLFLAASSVQALAELFVVPTYFPNQLTLFPVWPEYFPRWALTLFSGTLTLLFLPKLFSVLLVIGKGGAKAFGGAFVMIASLLLEVLVSTLLAPVRMLFHSLFVIGILLGRNWGWNAQKRDDSGTTWGEAARFYWKATLLGFVWGGLMYLANPAFFFWMSPIAAGLVLSIPLTVWSSQVGLGDAAHARRLFLTPEDTQPDTAVRALEHALCSPQKRIGPFFSNLEGFTRATVQPRAFLLHSALNARARRVSGKTQQQIEVITEKALNGGPGNLNSKEKLLLLGNPQSLHTLHRRVWALPPDKAALWGIG